MKSQLHWEKIYTEKTQDEVSWYAAHLSTSLAFIQRTQVSKNAAIIDVGGGESTLVDDLLALGYQNLTVLDISTAAIEASKKRLGEAGNRVHWITADITSIFLEPLAYDLWHDRAVFHFLTSPAGRAAYIKQVLRAVRPGGHIIVSTFGPEGPERCSGLEVIRYDADALHSEFGRRFSLQESSSVLHETPFGTTQQFLYCYCMLE